jgi:hypothetical protein
MHEVGSTFRTASLFVVCSTGSRGAHKLLSNMSSDDIPRKLRDAAQNSVSEYNQAIRNVIALHLRFSVFCSPIFQFHVSTSCKVQASQKSLTLVALRSDLSE